MDSSITVPKQLLTETMDRRVLQKTLAASTYGRYGGPEKGRPAHHMRFVRSVYSLTYLAAWIPAASKQREQQLLPRYELDDRSSTKY
jgi:hypothetical protein